MLPSRKLLPAIVTSLLLLTSSGQAADYFFDSDGGNNATGNGSQANPWATILKANTLDLAPGDRLLFQGGDTFSGQLYLGPEDNGTAANPVVVTSYGTGRAVINSGSTEAIYGYRVEYVTVSDIVCTGNGLDNNDASGIFFYHDIVNASLYGIEITNCEVSGYGQHGVSVGAWGGSASYDGTKIMHTVAFSNQLTGIFVGWAENNYSSQDLLISHCTAYGNLGDPSANKNTGSGILIANADGAIIQYSEAYDNGERCTASEGPVGIWCYYSKDVVIQYCISRNNNTGGPADGGGFDFDQDCVDCVLQYSFAYNNEGAGMLLIDSDGGAATVGSIVRYNIFENNGSENQKGAINIFGNVDNSEIYGNVFMQSNEDVSDKDDTTGNNSPVLRFDSTVGQSNNRFRNNVFIALDGKRFMDHSGTLNATKATLENNLYFTEGGAFALKWNGILYTSFASYRSASAQEANGLAADPLFAAPGAGDTEGIVPEDLFALASYRPASNSPVVDAGVDLASLGIASGGRDFRGAVSPRGSGYDLGAIEQSNLLPNGDIEAGMTGWSNWGRTSAQSTTVHGGTKALSTPGGEGGAGNNSAISSMAPGRLYRLSGWGKLTNAGETAWIGIQLLSGGVEVFNEGVALTVTTQWQNAFLNFETPAAFDAAVVWIWKGPGSGTLYSDDIELVELASAEDGNEPVIVGPYVAEAENVVVYTASDSITTFNDSNASGGKAHRLNANQTGDYVTYTLPDIPAGSYLVKVGAKQYQQRGRCQLDIDGTAVGGVMDQSGATEWVEYDLGTVTFTESGDHDFTFTVTGTSSGNYNITVDNISLIPSQVYEVEAEGTSYTATDSVTTFNDSAASGGSAHRLNSNAVGDSITYTLSGVPAGDYTVKVGAKKYANRGQCQLAIGGVNQGGVMEHAGATEWVEFDLGIVSFTSMADREFTFTVTGSSSGNYSITVDYIRLEQ